MVETVTQTTNGNVFRAEFWDSTESDNFLKEIALQLFGSMQLTIKHALEILSMLETFSEKSTELWLERIGSCNTIDEAKKVMTNSKVFNFDEVMSEQKIKSNLIKNELFSKPQRFCVRNEIVEYEPGFMTNIQHQGVLMDIKFQIKTFLELDGVLDGLIEQQNKLMEILVG